MTNKLRDSIAAALTLALALPGAAHAQAPDFGDDNSTFSKNGECDDMRFTGPAMTATLLIDSDIKHDATDCRNAFNAGRLSYAGGHRPAGGGTTTTTTINFGDDSSRYARNGECDDKRFSGAAMASILIDSDTNHDATDCRTAYTQGRATWNGGRTTTSSRDASHIVWGDDSSRWARNGECDDKRFSGAAMASILIDSDIKHDAQDCRRAYEQSRLDLR